MYKRVAGVENPQALSEVAGELRDRYGEPPAAVQNLLQYATLKIACQQVGVTQIERRRDLISIRFSDKAEIDPAKLAMFVSKNKGAAFTPQGILKFTMKQTRADEILIALRELLVEIASVPVEV